MSYSQVNFPKDTIDFVIDEGNQILNEQKIKILNNQATGNLNYKYHIFVDEFKTTTDFTVLFCDCAQCLENYPDTGTCIDLEPSKSWTFAVDITSKKAIENKYFSISFVNPNDSTVADTLTLRTVQGLYLGMEKEVVKNSFKIAPNPASDKVEVSFKSTISKEYNLSVVNLLGETVFIYDIYGVKNSSSEFTLDVSGFEPGIYFVVLNNGQDSEIQKLIVN